MLVENELKEILRTMLTQTVKKIRVDGETGEYEMWEETVSPDEKFLDALVYIITYIKMNAQILGTITNLTYNASGGLFTGVGGGIPGPVTATSTGVPLTGPGQIQTPPGVIQ